MPLEHSLVRNRATGQYTFAIGPDGDIAFDDKAVYPVLCCLLTRRGEYRWDGTLGTELRQIRNETLATASRFAAAGSEAIRRAKTDGWVTDGTSEIDRKGPGRWQLLLRYKTPSGSQTAQVSF